MIGALPKFAEKRTTQRKALTGLLPGRIAIAETSKHLSCKPVDISPEGLGIVTATLLEPGTILRLITHNQVIQLEVRWRQPDFGKRELHRYGLHRIDESIDIEAIFEQTGCIR